MFVRLAPGGFCCSRFLVCIICWLWEDLWSACSEWFHLSSKDCAVMDRWPFCCCENVFDLDLSWYWSHSGGADLPLGKGVPTLRSPAHLCACCVNTLKVERVVRLLPSAQSWWKPPVSCCLPSLLRLSHGGRFVSADRSLCMSELNVSGTVAQGAPLTSKDQYSYWHASQRRLQSDHNTLRWFIFTHTDTWLWGRRCSWNSPLPSPICVSSLQSQFCLTASLI